MKKYMLNLLLFCSFLFTFELFADSEKIEEFTLNPASYLRFWENNLKNYWRYDSEEREKKIDPELSIIVDTFHDHIGMLEQLAKLSGLADIEEISGRSVQFKNDNGDIHFKNKLVVEYDEDSKGFLKALFSELPAEKLPKLSENEKEIKDLHLIKNNTMLAFEMPFNFNAVMKTDFKDSRCCSKINDIARKYFSMSAAELADCLTGVWGGIININKFTEGAHAGKFHLAFMFVIPDPGKKLFKNLGEYLVINHRAVYKDKVLRWRTASLLREIVMISSDNFMIISSSPTDMMKFAETAEKKEIDAGLKKIDVPDDADENAYIYWNREFAAVANSFLLSKPYAVRFMEDFTGNDTFNVIEFDDDEVEIMQYSTAPFSQMLFMPFSMSFMAHYDSWIFNIGRRKYIARKIASGNQNCMDEMKVFAEKLKAFKQKFGKYPKGINAEGLKKFADFAKISEDRFSLKTGEKKSTSFNRYYYWGENYLSERHDMPLFCDRGNVHTDKLHIIFCDGSVREFELKNVRSAKRIASFLHTVFKYDNVTFAKLLKQAEKLDSEKL